MADRRAALAVLSLVFVTAVGTTGTYASWSSSKVVPGASMSSGVLDLKVNGSDAVGGLTALNISSLLPGDSSATVFTVTNSGTVPVKYHLDASASNPDGLGLGSALVARVTGATSVTGTSPSATCGGSVLAGTSSLLGSNLVGSSASPRTLAAGASEKLCLQLTLPLGAALSLEGSSTSVTLTFSGTQ